MFGPGESIRTFQNLGRHLASRESATSMTASAARVEILNDDAFDTTLEFDIELDEPENCLLDPRCAKCVVARQRQRARISPMLSSRKCLAYLNEQPC